MAYPVSPQDMYKVAGLAALVCDTICLINVLCANEVIPDALHWRQLFQ